MWAKYEALAEGARLSEAIAEARAAFAIDGVFTPDWTRSLAEASEVILLARVAGGWRTVPEH